MKWLNTSIINQACIISYLRPVRHSVHQSLPQWHRLVNRVYYTSRFVISYLILILSVCTIEHATISFEKSVLACTATHNKKNGIMLKSYDWHDGAGVLYFNPKGIKRYTFPHESLRGKQSGQSLAHSWYSRFASVSFNQYGRGFPNGGINERGLAIEVLWLNETEYVEQDQRPYLNELEWVQYVLDTCETVEQIEALLTKVRISPIHGQVHYFFCDQGGHCGALEFIKGDIKFYLNELQVPSLTNHSYEQSMAYAKQQKIHESERSSQVNQDNRGSLARFLSAQELAKSKAITSLQLGLEALEQVEIKGYTKWQIAYDLKHLKLAFKMSNSSKIRRVDFSHLVGRLKALSSSTEGCSAIMSYSLSGKEDGALSSFFAPPIFKQERAHLRQRFARLKLPQQLADALATHGKQCSDLVHDSTKH